MLSLRQSLAIPAFARLLATYTANELADWLITIALSVLVFDATGDPLATTALFVAMKFLPGFAVPALTARLDAGSHARGRVLVVLYALLTAVLTVLAVASTSFWLPGVLVLALVAGTLAATARAITRVANVGVLEPRGLLREGNATLNFGFSAVNAGGPVAAGALVALVDPVGALTAAAVVFAVETLVMAGARLPGPDHATDGDGGWRAHLREGLEYVRHHPLVRTLLVGQVVVIGLLTMVTPIEVVYAKETLGAGDVGFGLIVAAWGAGMVAGSLVFARQHGRSVTTLVVGATVVMAAGYLVMAVAPGLAVACVGAALGGLGNGVQWVAGVTALQEATEDRFQARVAGLLETVLAVAPGIGFVLGGTLTALLSPRPTFLVAGVGVLVVVALGVLMLRRGPGTPVATPLRPERAPVADALPEAA